MIFIPQMKRHVDGGDISAAHNERMLEVDIHAVSNAGKRQRMKFVVTWRCWRSVKYSFDIFIDTIDIMILTVSHILRRDAALNGSGSASQRLETSAAT